MYETLLGVINAVSMVWLTVSLTKVSKKRGHRGYFGYFTPVFLWIGNCK